MLETIDSNSGKISDIVKIHFNIQKEVQFGKAVYVAGNIESLGSWDILQSVKLKWNEGHQWMGQIVLNRKQYKQIQFKYAIADWQKPSQDSCQWEDGVHNRALSLDSNRKMIVCDHKWSMDKITLILFVNENLLSRQYYLIGNISQLGSWKSARQMKNAQLKEFQSQSFVQKKGATKSRCQVAFSYTFFTNRSPKNIHYYYINKSVEFQKQRNPSRILNFGNLNNNKHPERLHVTYNSGDIQVFETCQFNQLHISQISEDIFLGAYPRSKEDFAKLKEMGISAVLGIQTKQDFNSHGLSSYYLKILCEQFDIKYHSYSIKDQSREDFLSKSLGGFLLLRKLIVEDKCKVYVHCSAGMYRSPQIIVLYLSQVQGYSLESAIDLVIDKHPFARPNYSLLRESLNLIDSKMTQAMEPV